MKRSLKEEWINKQKRVIQAVLFLAAVIVVAYLFPRESKFRYHFQEGKPWKYGLLTAPFDFPIYKSDAQIQHERDSILSFFRPYYAIDGKLEQQMLSAFDADYKEWMNKKMPRALYKQVRTQLQMLYANGILSAEAYDRIAEESDSTIMVLRNNLARRTPLSTLPSIKPAYEELIDAIPNEPDRFLLRSLKLNNYITDNLHPDSILNQHVRDELLEKIAISSGVVQAGERIVDRGEVISPQTFLILQSLESQQLQSNVIENQREVTLLGEILIITLLFGCMYLFLYFFRRRELNHLPHLIFILLMITGTTAVSYVVSDVRILGIYLVPFAIQPIIICSLLDSRIAFFSSLITILLNVPIAPFPMEFLFLQFAVTATAIFTLHDLTKRSQLVRCAIIIYGVYCFCYIGYTLLMEGDWSKINADMFLYLGINCVQLLFAYLFIYLLEKTFGFISNVTLVELSDINAPILRELSERCPGTFQHSLQISNLAAEAAIKIGANSLLVRTGALYHDIGKLNNPAFYTENQSADQGNPHNGLTPEESAQIIIQHVSDGVKIAERLMLPKPIIRFIETHHGRGKTKYFYNTFCNAHPDEPVNEAAFTYPGPNPSTKEEAILMLADSSEAASRSLRNYTEESLSQLVNDIIDGYVHEGLLKEANISLRDIETVKEIFIEKLKTFYHTRISYPKLNREETTKASAPQTEGK